MWAMNRATLVLASVVVATTASAHQSANSSATVYGAKVPVTAVVGARHIVITPQTKWVNVTDGQTVIFKLDSRTFSWRFEIWPNKDTFSLAKIAPADVDVSGVQVYVATNPLYAE
jgi:hypothetical protein